jgi:hypothetical protein
MMSDDRRVVRTDFGAVLAVALLGTAGCMNFAHPVPPPPCAPMPSEEACRAHVHVFMVNGLDPLGYANFEGVGEYLRQLGYCHVHYARLCSVASMDNEIRHVQCTDPSARVALVGYSFGANGVNHLSRRAADDGRPIGLLVHLDGVFLSAQPPRCGGCRTVHVYCRHWWKEAPELPGADNVRIPDVGHYDVPTQEVVIDVLTRELDAYAGVAHAEVPPLGRLSVGEPLAKRR